MNPKKLLSKTIAMPFYILYRTGVSVRNLLYDTGIKKPQCVDARIISVGGLSFGGSGKSPMTMYLASKAVMRASEIGSTAIVSRGYHRRSRGFVIVSDGKGIKAGVHQAGDELYMIAGRVPRAVVIADEVRHRGAENAVKMFNVKNIILDDGFQKRSLERTVNIVMVEPELIMSGKFSFMREGLSSLKRADAVIVLGSDEVEREAVREKLAKYTGAKIFFGHRKPVDIKNLENGKIVDVKKLQGKKVSAFCGLADPSRFDFSLRQMGIECEKLLAFPDHCAYNERDLTKVARFFVESGAEALITTEKDAVKLPPLLNSLPIYYLTIDLEIEEEGEFLKLIFDI